MQDLRVIRERYSCYSKWSKVVNMVNMKKNQQKERKIDNMYIQKMKHKIPLLLFDAGRTKKNGKYINVITENHKTAKKNYLK